MIEMQGCCNKCGYCGPIDQTGSHAGCAYLAVEVMPRTVEESVASLENIVAGSDPDDPCDIFTKLDIRHVIADWRKRGEALRKARVVVEASAEIALATNFWAQGIPLNALDAIDEALGRPVAAQQSQT